LKKIDLAAPNMRWLLCGGCSWLLCGDGGCSFERVKKKKKEMNRERERECVFGFCEMNEM
jgi:sulfatase maturation enzyme AslB (radical SAM superfamily)